MLPVIPNGGLKLLQRGYQAKTKDGQEDKRWTGR